MRVFLSVAGPDRPKVEEVALALRGEGHEVFLDKDDLPPGDSYHHRIRHAIFAADVVVFFISPYSLERDRYTLTELKIIQERFRHPRGRVLPVIVSRIDENRIPAYLRAVTYCKPQGNVAADVAYEVSKMAAAFKKREHVESGLIGGGYPPTSQVVGVAWAVGLALLAVLVALITEELDKVLSYNRMPTVAFNIFHGMSLTLLTWLAALLFNVRDPAAYVALALASMAAYFVEMAFGLDRNLTLLFIVKSAVFACIAMTALVGFRSCAGFAGLIVASAVAGQIALSLPRAKLFIWEAVLIFCIALVFVFCERQTERTK